MAGNFSGAYTKRANFFFVNKQNNKNQISNREKNSTLKKKERRGNIQSEIKTGAGKCLLLN